MEVLVVSLHRITSHLVYIYSSVVHIWLLKLLYYVQVEGLCSPTPPFSWIRIGDMDKFNNAVVNGTVDPVVDYTVLEQEHPFDERGVPAHSIFEYVLTREDVGHYIGVRYEDTPVKNSKSDDADRNKKSNCKQETTNEQLLFLTDEMDGKRQSDGDASAVAAPSNSLLEESAVSAAAADANAATVRLALESVITQMEGGEKASEVAADSQNLPSPPATQPQELSTGAVAEGLTEERKEDSVERPATAAVTEKQIKSIYRFLTLVSHGPVKPGPPRLTEFNIAGSMKVQCVHTFLLLYFCCDILVSLYTGVLLAIRKL